MKKQTPKKIEFSGIKVTKCEEPDLIITTVLWHKKHITVLTELNNKVVSRCKISHDGILLTKHTRVSRNAGLSFLKVRLNKKPWES